MAGGFWGGLAEGVESGQGVAQRQQALSLQQQQMQQQADLQRENMALTLKKYLGESAEKIIDKNVGEIDNLLKIAETAVGNGKVEQAQKLGPAIQAAVQKVQKVAGPLGLADRIPDFSPRFEAILGTTLTPMEQGGKQGMVNLGQQATENAGGLPGMKGAAEGAQAVAAQPGKSAAEVANIGATAAPKANAAALSTAATTGAQIAAEANNLPAVQAISGAKSAGQTAGEIRARFDNLTPLAATEKTIAEVREKAKSEAGASSQAFQNANTLRDEFTKLTQPFQTIQSAYKQIEVSAKDPTPAGDLSLLYGYMKMLDQNSVVRESEFAAAAQAGSFGDRMAAAVNRIMTGKRLADDMRDDFVNRSKDILNAARGGYDSIRADYEARAKRAGVDPRDALPQFDQTPRFAPGSIIEVTIDGKAQRARVNPDGKTATPLQ